MTALQLITLLEQRIEANGDGPVYCQDGLDPSDPAEVTDVKDHLEWDVATGTYKVINRTATRIES